MAWTKKLFKKDTAEFTGTPKQGYGNIIKNRRMRVAAIVMGVLAVVLCVAGYLYFSETYRVYGHGEVVSSEKREDTDTVRYVSYANGIMKYSSDGASYITGDLKVMWNITYELQSPIYATSNEYVAIAEIGGTEIFVCNTNGQVCDIDTLLPVQKMSVSANGIVAALLEDDGKSWIRIYNSAGSGTILAEVSVIMDQSGYPADFCMSQDGIKLGITHLRLTGGKINTLAVFHNLGSVGENKTDHLVSSKTFSGEMMPQLQYINDETAFAVGTSELDIFTGKQIPELTFQKKIQGEVLYTFYSNKYFGMELKNTEEQENYVVKVYNAAGKEVFSKGMSEEYQQIQLFGEYVIMSNEGSMAVYSLNGIEKFQGKFNTTVMHVKPLAVNKYLLVTPTELQVYHLQK